MYLSVFLFLSFFIHFSGDETGVCLFVVYVVGAYHTFLGIYAFPFTFIFTFTIMGLVWLYANLIDDNSVIVLYMLSLLFTKLYIVNTSFLIQKLYIKHNTMLLIFYTKKKKKLVFSYFFKKFII